MATRGARRHLVTLSVEGPPVSNGDGGYTQTPVALSPSTRWAEIKPATTRDLERVTSGTVLSTESLLVTMDFHPDVTQKTQLAWTDAANRSHVANVTGVTNPDQRCETLILIAVEVIA
jgi:head-tail adaptor